MENSNLSTILNPLNEIFISWKSKGTDLLDSFIHRSREEMREQHDSVFMDRKYETEATLKLRLGEPLYEADWRGNERVLVYAVHGKGKTQTAVYAAINPDGTVAYTGCGTGYHPKPTSTLIDALVDGVNRGSK